MSFNIYAPLDPSNPLTSALQHAASLADLPHCQQLPANSVVFMDTERGLQQIFDNRIGATPPADPNIVPDIAPTGYDVGDDSDSAVTSDSVGNGAP